MPSKIITNAPGVYVLERIDKTFKTGGGPLVASTVTIAKKGLPGIVHKLTMDNWMEITGGPLHKKTAGMEGLRHVNDALPYCSYINWIRVMAADAKFPSMTLKLADAAITKAGHAYGTVLTVGEGFIFQIWMNDGHNGLNRGLLIRNIDDTTERFNLVVTETVDGVTTEIADYLVGVDPDDKDDMGAPAYIETVLATGGILQCDYNEVYTYTEIKAKLTGFATAQAFTGGLDGGAPTEAEWKTAWDNYREETTPNMFFFAAGNYDTAVLTNCFAIADLRQNQFFYDLPPTGTPAACITWMTAFGQDSPQAAAYYCPWAAEDSFSGGKAVWGASGEAVAAMAKGWIKYTGNIPGVHYAPAGSDRARFGRTNAVRLLADRINRDDFVASRINPVVASDSGGIAIDDAISTHFKENYSRFIWVNSIFNYIVRRFLQAAAAVKFEPSGITVDILNKLVTEIWGIMGTPMILCVKLKGDERVLGDSDFVENILNAAGEALEERYELKASGYDFDWRFPGLLRRWT